MTRTKTCLADTFYPLNVTLNGEESKPEPSPESGVVSLKRIICRQYIYIYLFHYTSQKMNNFWFASTV